RVTFASDKDQRKASGHRSFSASSLKFKNSGRGKQQAHSCPSSALSQDSGRTSLMGCDDMDIYDADMMWAELSSHDSDDDMKDDIGTQNLVTEEDFFMAKFDLLNMQFEAAKAELRQDKLKSAL
ncbi:hypothetical protein EGW08_005142, partial [Elysia chlorotica]